jgi:hypothetical protein
VVLLAGLLVSIGFIFAFLPLYLALAYKGRGKGSVLLELSPIAALSGLLWRLWTPAKTAEYEELRKAYNDGKEAGAKTRARATTKTAVTTSNWPMRKDFT